MKNGQIVMVYEKPLTKENPEGKAKLLSRIISNRDSEIIENWKIKFILDGFICERLINLQNGLD